MKWNIEMYEKNSFPATSDFQNSDARIKFLDFSVEYSSSSIEHLMEKFKLVVLENIDSGHRYLFVLSAIMASPILLKLVRHQ